MTSSSSNPNTPHSSDAILGGDNPAPLQSGILGGIDGLRQKLKNSELTLRLEALDQAWGYGESGQTLLREVLEDRSKVLRRRARWLLRQPTGAELSPEPVWTLTERLEGPNNNNHATRFANREVQDFDPDQFNAEQPLATPQQVVYALRCEWDNEESVAELLPKLLALPGADQIEALVIGCWQSPEDICTGDDSLKSLVDTLVAFKDRLTNLKALFMGDITYEECEISWLQSSDVSPILHAYPQLEILQVRGGTGLKFENPIKHEHLKALILETGGLSRDTVHQVYKWDFPALEHLEFWFGSDNYGGDCWEQDLAPILDNLRFPNLAYLGLRNSGFTNEMMDRVVKSPLLGGLQVLDLSMGTLTDTGAAKLLDCPAIKDLETLNVSESYLSGAMIDQLSGLGIQVVADEQRVEEDYEEPEYRRYCVVSE